MSPADPRDGLLEILRATRATEIDCDAFFDHLAAYVEDPDADPALAALMVQHHNVCPECEEEWSVLRRALGLKTAGR